MCFTDKAIVLLSTKKSSSKKTVTPATTCLIEWQIRTWVSSIWFLISVWPQGVPVRYYSSKSKKKNTRSEENGFNTTEFCLGASFTTSKETFASKWRLMKRFPFTWLTKTHWSLSWKMLCQITWTAIKWCLGPKYAIVLHIRLIKIVSWYTDENTNTTSKSRSSPKTWKVPNVSSSSDTTFSYAPTSTK